MVVSKTIKNITAILFLYCIGVLNGYSQSDSVAQISDYILDYYQKVPMEKIHVHTDRSCYASGDTIWFRAYLVDAATNKPCNRSKFIYTELRDDTADTLVVRYKIKSDSAGIFANAIPLPQTLKTGDYTFVAYTKWMQNFSNDQFSFKRMQIVNSKEPFASLQPHYRSVNKIALSLMPEGGHLLDGFSQFLAFKVTDDNGLGVDANIMLTDDKGKVLQTTRTQHLGMGKMLVHVRSDEQLFVEAEAMDKTARVAVPKALKSGVSLSVTQHGDKVHIQPFATADIDLHRMSLVLYGAGNIMEIPVMPNKLITIPKSDLRPGVVNIAIVEQTEKTIYAERLIFIREEATSMSVAHAQCDEDSIF